MNEESARVVLADMFDDQDQLYLFNDPVTGGYTWTPSDGHSIEIDGVRFTVEEMEAIAWWVRNKGIT